MATPSDDIDHTQHMQPNEKWDCRAVRSATTSEGETDVLVRYQSEHATKPRVAILIEDKIRAGFQKDQAARYRSRGSEGERTGQWDSYWTCLIAPEKYAKDNEGFDTRISLERLAEFFSGSDERTHFKAEVLRRALQHFAVTGLQIKDEPMTGFRAFYADEAQALFAEDEIEWEKARDAWRDDQWFNFTGGSLPTGLKIIYKAKKGSVELTCPKSDVASLERILEHCSHNTGITVEQVGKGAGFGIHVEPISEFTNHAASKPIVIKSLEAVRVLLNFCRANGDQIASISRS